MLIRRAVSGTTTTDTNTSHGRSFEPCDSSFLPQLQLRKRLTSRGQHRRRGDGVQNSHSRPRHDDQIREALATTSASDPDTFARQRTFRPTTSAGSSTASHRWKTYSSLTSTPSGATPSAKTPTVYTCRTPHGNAKPTIATPRGRTTLPLRKATPIGRSTHRRRTLLAPQAMVSIATQHGRRDHPLPRLTRHVLPRGARLARRGRTTMMERRGFSTATPA
jgi:hypothetical protein